MVWALFWVTSASVIQKKDDFMSGNQTFTDGDPRKTAMFHSFFQMFLRLLNLITRGGTPQPLGSYAFCQGLNVFKTICLWLKHEIFTVIFTSSRAWEIGLVRVITQQYASLFKKKANKSMTPEQTYSQLDVQTSRFLFPLATAS